MGASAAFLGPSPHFHVRDPHEKEIIRCRSQPSILLNANIDSHRLRYCRFIGGPLRPGASSETNVKLVRLRTSADELLKVQAHP
jgi:hypothetical protein